MKGVVEMGVPGARLSQIKAGWCRLLERQGRLNEGSAVGRHATVGERRKAHRGECG